MSIFSKFQNPDVNAKAMFRWWFPDASAKSEKVVAQMKEMYDGGFGGVEVQYSPGYASFDPAGPYAWATPAWREIVKTILKTAAEEMPGEFKVDFNQGPHWPSSSNRIVPNDDVQVQELLGAFEKLTKTPKGCGRIPMPEIKTNDHDFADAADYIFENKFVGMTVARVASIDGVNIVLEWDSMQDVSTKAKQEIDPQTGEPVWTPAGIPLHENKYGDMPKLRDRQFYYVTDRSVLPASDNDDEEIKAGDWLLFGFWRRGSGQSTSGRNFDVFNLNLPHGPKCYAINGWDPKGPGLLAKVWEDSILNDPEVRNLLKKIGATTDSCFKGGGGLGGETVGLWAATFPEDFYNVRGYDVMPYLPILCFHDYKLQFVPYLQKYYVTADNGNDERLFEDFYMTAIWIHMNRCSDPFATWAKQFGYGVRAKNYAPMKEASWSTMICDQAEGATLDLRMKMDNFRDMTSGVHVAGKTIVAAEANADELMAYRLTFKNVCEKLNICYATGLNLAIFHGASYDEESSGKFSQWPGWHAFQFTFAGAWGRRHPWWPGVHYLSDYLARTQGALQSGTVKIDLLAYEPIRNSKEVWDGAAKGGDYNKLIGKGYSYDIGGEALIIAAAKGMKNGRLAADGPAYKALILRGCEFTTLAAMEQMIELAEAGYPVISVGRLPERVRGMEGHKGVTDEMICAAVERLMKAKGYYHVDGEDGLLAKLQELNIQPDLPYEAPGVANIQRTDENSRWFYLYNPTKEVAYIPAKTEPGRNAYVADPWSGEIYRLDRTEMALMPGAARFLVYADEGVFPTNLETYTVPGEKMTDLTDFALVIDSWGPAGDPNDPCKSKHTTLDMGKVNLVYWDTMEGPVDAIAKDGSQSMYNVSGIGEYVTKYHADKDCDAYLMTESGEDQIVGIYVNGVEQQRPDAVARYSKIHLDKGENEICIKLATTLRRRVNLENPFFTEHDFEIMFAQVDNASAVKAPDPATMNRYGLTAVKLCEVK